jgi:DNA-binding HxlR family transcriptional regulator
VLDRVEPSSADRELIHGVGQALDVLNGKWKTYLVVCMARGIRRNSVMRRHIPGASKKVVIQTLRVLERDGLVVRRVSGAHPQVVEYSLTPLGWSVTEPLVALAEWSELHAAQVLAARALHGASRQPRNNKEENHVPDTPRTSRRQPVGALESAAT